jgi:hypothetical protein
VSAHSASHQRGWLSAIAAQVSDYVFEPIEETVEAEPPALTPHPVIAVVSAAPSSGTTTVARLLGAELAARAGGAAVVTSPGATRRTAPPSRAAIRLATALAGVAGAQPCGRLCLAHVRALAADAGDLAEASAVGSTGSELAGIVSAARYLAPVVLDLPADGSAAAVATIAERVAVVAAATSEPALLDAVAALTGGEPLKVVNRVTDATAWGERGDAHLLPDSRIAVRAAAMGTRALGPLGSAIAELADALAASR